MSSTDGERLAPVTYLFGATAPQAEHETVQHDSVQQEQQASPSEDLPQDSAKVVARGEGKFDRISNVSMYALARRGMSSREMRDYLAARDFEQAEVAEEIERLESVGLLDDDSLAETLVRTLRDRKGLGKGGLTAELRRRNLDAVAIETAMSAVVDDELERATEIASKRAGQLRGLDNDTARRRLGAFLMRKGYSGSVVSQAVSSALTPTGPVFR